jgi:hypothetical protein
MRSVKNEKGYQVSVLNSKVCVCGEYIRPSCYLELIFWVVWVTGWRDPLLTSDPETSRLPEGRRSAGGLDLLAKTGWWLRN